MSEKTKEWLCRIGDIFFASLATYIFFKEVGHLIEKIANLTHPNFFAVFMFFVLIMEIAFLVLFVHSYFDVQKNKKPEMPRSPWKFFRGAIASIGLIAASLVIVGWTLDSVLSSFHTRLG